MDGNRRWARERGLPAWHGHHHGVTPLWNAITCCIDQGVLHLSVFAFSLDNRSRSHQEQTFLCNFLRKQLIEYELPRLQEWNVRVDFIGHREHHAQNMQDDMAYVERVTQDNTALSLHIFFCYDGREDIRQATQALCREYAGNPQTEITPELFASYLQTREIPDPDLVIRTGGRQRVSNFLIYQMAYSEIYFLSTYWPDIGYHDITAAIQTYQETPRTFGA